jgi:hypothetical protein
MEPKGYIGALDKLILTIRSQTDRDLFKERAQGIKVSHIFGYQNYVKDVQAFHWLNSLNESLSLLKLALQNLIQPSSIK